MNRIYCALIAGILALPAAAELTREQKIADMTQLANVFAKYYAPYEWKRQALGFDMMDLKPWLDKAAATKTDVEFMELLVDYAASLDDGHVGVFFASDFYADTGIRADIYEGKVLIDRISRALLPTREYPFVEGDEIVSVEGKPVAEVIKSFTKYYAGGNPRTTARVAVSRILTRSQELMPRAAEVGESLTMVIRRANGQEETYNIPWSKSGIPVRGAGPVVSPKSASRARAAEAERAMGSPYTQFRVPTPARMTLGWGALAPIFATPSNFVRRRGGGASDTIYTGTFEYDGLRIGFIRIPDFEPESITFALTQFETEIRYMQANTDGLVIDVMRNPGGYGPYCEELLRRVMPTAFRTMGFEIRATNDWVIFFSTMLDDADYYGYPDWAVAALQANLEMVQMANSEVRGRTGPVSLNGLGSLMLLPASTVYTKPLMVLTDELSASAGDFFPAIIQDHKRGPIFGYRTMGLGGGPTLFDSTYFSESYAYVTRSLMVRAAPVKTAEYPESAYVENVGVRPDIEMDYMTRDNLMNRGRTFVEGFSKAIAAHIRASQPK